MTARGLARTVRGRAPWTSARATTRRKLRCRGGIEDLRSASDPGSDRRSPRQARVGVVGSMIASGPPGARLRIGIAELRAERVERADHGHDSVGAARTRWRSRRTPDLVAAGLRRRFVARAVARRRGGRHGSRGPVITQRMASAIAAGRGAVRALQRQVRGDQHVGRTGHPTPPARRRSPAARRPGPARDADPRRPGARGQRLAAPTVTRAVTAFVRASTRVTPPPR